MANENLTAAKNKKSDEFYTQYEDIQREVNAYIEFDPDTFRGKTVLLPCDDPEWSNFTRFFAQNFEMLGLKKLISTSYAYESKQAHEPVQLSMADFLTDFETDSPLYDAERSPKHGRIFTLTRRNKKVDIDDLQWKYLEGDGDFRSAEVTALRDEADIIVTNPPFSLFREFLAWIMEANKKFLIIGSINCVSYKEVFPLMKNNVIWLGVSITSGDRKFHVPDAYPLEAAGCGIDENGKKFIRVKGVRWITNLDHGRRHQWFSLMSMEDNIKFSKHKEVRGNAYVMYDNYAALEVPFSDAIPDDYNGIMGVPITFMDKYCPEQFEIIGITLGNTVEYEMTKIYTAAIQHNKNGSTQPGSKVNTRAAICVSDKPTDTVYYTADNCDGYLLSIYPRILIRRIVNE